MEKLIKMQFAQKEIIETFIKNYKKDGSSRRTEKYYLKRLSDFQVHWDDFVKRHKEILVEKYSKENFDESTESYFAQNIFSQMEEFFTINYSNIEQRFRDVYPSAETTAASETKPTCFTLPKAIETSIKLPKIVLEKFSGDYKKWSTFHDLFKTLVHDNKTLNSVQKLQYLKLHLDGEAEGLLRHFQVTDSNYEAAWELLKDRYDNKRILVSTQLGVLFNQSLVTHESAQGVKALLDTTTECLKALSNLQVDVSSWDPIIVFFIIQKLPQQTRELWEQGISTQRDLPSWEKLKEFLEGRFRALEAINSKEIFNQKITKSQLSKFKNHSQSFHTASNAMCSLCSDEHNLRQCPKFIDMNQAKRMEIIKLKGLCINCLGAGHLLTNCPSQHKCFHCKRRHHTLLHRKAGESSQEIPQVQYNNGGNMRAQSPSSLPNTLSHTATPFVSQTAGSIPNNLSTFATNRNLNEQQILLATAMVKILSPAGHEQIVRALIDQGSQASFLTESVVQNLRLPKESISANITGLGQTNAGYVNHRTKFTIQSLTSKASVEISALVLRKLTHFLPAKEIFSRNWHHLEGLELADPHYYIPGKIDMLLGADVYSRIITSGLIKGAAGSPIAQKTLFGWILSGETTNTNERLVTVNNFHLCADLNEQLKKFWELEEIKPTVRYTEEEQACEDHFLHNYRRLVDGRFEVCLPFKKTKPEHYIGKSRGIALARLYQIEARLKKNPSLREEYVSCMRGYMSLGHMQKVSTKEEHFAQEGQGITSYTCSYLPHHAVVKEESTTTKVRVVFDASKKTQSGTSLNEMLLKGPVIQDDLTSLLIRWRKYKIAFTADLEKMYRQIRVNNNHAEYQRILWRESPDEPAQDYKLLTVTFGTKSAPFLATRVIKQLALDEKDKYPIASELAQTAFYVDDLIAGADNIDLAVKAQKQLMELMNAGGFSLRKWASNCGLLMKILSSEQEEINLALDSKGADKIKTLGIYWKPHTDIISYSAKVEIAETKWNKRNILSEIAKLFDPMGCLAPILIIAKIIMQRLWLAGLTWDEDIPTEIENEWLNYRHKLEDVNLINVNRWLQYSEKDVDVELHGFCDASIKAYAAVVYLCSVDSNGHRSSNLVAAKTKIAPIKLISLPRLELCGAFLLAKLLGNVSTALGLSRTPKIFAWTDSEIVLAWLRGHPSKWTTFVANRVSLIHQWSEQTSWGYVSSKDNPADCASRGMYAEELHKHELWWKGPQWLVEPSQYWPQKKTTPSTNFEERKLMVNYAETSMEDWEEKYSSLTKLIRVTAYCKRFLYNSRISANQRERGHLKAKELQNALEIWLKVVQSKYFINEIKALRHHKNLDKGSRLIKLNPFLDSDGIIRVGGRLKHADLTYEKKHPIILPDKCHLTKLLVHKTHNDTLHGGPQLMMNILAQRYWILNARNTVRQVIHQCMSCHRQKANAQIQLMGDLPEARVKRSRPFSHSGLDYCGPFELKTHKGRNPKKYKAYIAIFICMAIKAIHIELVTDLSAEGFIAAYRRFSARRGLCSDIYCDNGSNFVGANRILRKQHSELLNQIKLELASIFENEGTNFHFIPPASPHFGGLWESGVRSTKYHLTRILKNALLTYEEFNTILVQIEGCLNSRLWCEMSRDPDDLNPLTPAHFLIGETLKTLPEPSVLDTQMSRLNRWQFLQRLYQSFWKRWNSEYLCRLQQRPKWLCKTNNVQIGDLILLKDEQLPPSRWLLGRITATHPGPDGLVRVVTIKTKETTLKRPITKICLLPIETRKADTNRNEIASNNH